MTKTIRNLIAAMLLIGASQGAMAVEDFTYQTGNSLLAICESEHPSDDSLCLGYMEAVSDTYMTLLRWKEFEPDTCIPNGVTARQLIKIWTKWANEHPEQLHFEAAGVVLYAFLKAFPCD
jgi:hypothetical protein